MEKGDLSNRVSPRCLIVFENAVAFCTNTKRSDRLLAKSRTVKALKYWQLNEPVIARVLYLFHHKDLSFDIVTFLGEDFGVELKHWLDTLNIPFHWVIATTPVDLGRHIAYMPDLAYVYDPDPERWLMYGSKGIYLQDASQIGDFTSV